MMPHPVYLYLAMSLVALWLLDCRFDFKYRNMFLVVSGLALAAVLALRNAEFGNIDMSRYQRYYWDMKYEDNFFNAIFLSNGKDKGYWGISWLFSKFGFSFQNYISTISVFTICVYLYYIWRYSPNGLLSNMIFIGSGCYTFMFYGIRQMLAMTFVLIAIELYHRRLYIYLTLIYIVAILCHWSAYVIIPLLLVGRLKFTHFVVYGYFTTLIIMLLFSDQIGHFITIMASEEYEDVYASSGRIGAVAIICLMVLIWYLIIYHQSIKKNEKQTFVLHGLVILTMIQIASSYAYSFTRLNYYYMFAIMTIAVPMGFDRDSMALKYGKDAKILSYLLSMAYMILMVYLFFNYVQADRTGLAEYVFKWEEL